MIGGYPYFRNSLIGLYQSPYDPQSENIGSKVFGSDVAFFVAQVKKSNAAPWRIGTAGSPASWTFLD